MNFYSFDMCGGDGLELREQKPIVFQLVGENCVVMFLNGLLNGKTCISISI